MTKQTDCWGCPDWAKRELYPSSPQALKDWQWKWEFVRRNPMYRLFWEQCNKEEHGTDNPSDLPHKLDIHAWWLSKCEKNFGISNIQDPASIPETNPFQSPIYPGLIHMSVMELKERYGPLTDSQRVYELQDLLRKIGFLTHAPDSEPIKVAIFDLNMPLKPQLEKIESALKQQADLYRKEMQKFGEDDWSPENPHMHGKSRNTWTRHLRVLDAKQQGATHEEIYAQFIGEYAGDDEEFMDEFYRQGKQPRAIVSQWVKQANDVMRNVSRFL